MVIDRRTLLRGSAALGCSAVTAGAEQLGAPQLFAAARKNAKGGYSAAIFDPKLGEILSIDLPGRGHDIAVRPGTGECVAFARRPGNFAVAFKSHFQTLPITFYAREGRHFYGHGVFSPDGHYLYTSENAYDTARGVIGVRDVRRGYRQVAEFSSGGVGPHDLALLSDGHRLVVANGGIETHPDHGRAHLNLASMSPSLCYIDVRSGKTLARHKFDHELHQLSLRHLTIGANDRVIVGCQYKGKDGKRPNLIGTHIAGGQIKLIELPDDVTWEMQNYIASIEADPSGRFVVASAPRGGMAIMVDIAQGRYVGKCQLDDVSGVAPTNSKAGFLLTAGHGGLVEFSSTVGVEPASLPGRDGAYSWDNHLVRL